MKMRILYIAIFLILYSNSTFAQYIEDGIRYTNSNGAITTRAASFGVANYGISDDASAIYFNPAGLMFVNKAEFNLGMSFTNNSADTRLFDSISNFSSNTQYLNNVSLVAPLKFHKKDLYVFGISYFMENNFDLTTKFDAFNKDNITMIQNAANNKEQYINSLGLSDTLFRTVYKDSLMQKGYIKESGGIHNVSAALAVNLSEFVTGGVSFTGKFGKYTYNRTYQEVDVLNKFNTYPNDLESFTENQTYSQEFSGFNLGVGIMAKVSSFMRLSAKIQTPTWYEIHETYKRDATAIYDADKNNFKDKVSQDLNDGETRYRIQTPFVYSAGLSAHLLGLTMAAGVEYQDAAQIEFADADQAVLDLNKEFQMQLRGLVKWGVAAEYQVPLTDLILRMGYEKRTSAYKENLDRIYTFAFGGGWVIDKNIRIDANYRLSQYSDKYFLYGSNYYYYTYTPSTVSLGLTYRY